jgi:hypothetical protein
MSEDALLALKRSATLLAVLAGALFVPGLVWALVDHHRIGFAVAVFYYFGAACIAVYSAFGNSMSRTTWDALPEDERDARFQEQMWLYAIAAALGLLGFALQRLF